MNILLAGLISGIIAGLAATPHCAGMCGAFPLHLSRATGTTRPIYRQILFLLGKTFTYAFLGALAGLAGSALQHRFAGAQNVLSYVLGGAMLLFGLAMLDLIPALRFPFQLGGKFYFLESVYSFFFRQPGLYASFLLGICTGFLPCPITAAAFLAATATQSVPVGILTMIGLSMGTSPILFGLGISGIAFDTRLRRIGLRGAGAIVMILGLLTILRTTSLFHQLMPGCPSCHHETTQHTQGSH